MAIVNDNELTSQLRGRVGRYLVFRNIRGRIIASRAPRKPDPRKQSAAQRKTRVTFRDAAAWAVRTMQNPYEKQRCQELAKKRGLTNAYTAAVQHYMQRSSTKGKREVQSQQKLTKSAKAKTMKFCNDDKGVFGFSAATKQLPSYTELLHWWFENGCGSAEIRTATTTLPYHEFKGRASLKRHGYADLLPLSPMLISRRSISPANDS